MGECVFNLVLVNELAAVNRLALKTGPYPIPESKQRWEYRFEPHKFGVAGLTSLASKTFGVSRVTECPVPREATVAAVGDMAEKDVTQRGDLVGIEYESRVQTT